MRLKLKFNSGHSEIAEELTNYKFPKSDLKLFYVKSLDDYRLEFRTNLSVRSFENATKVVEQVGGALKDLKINAFIEKWIQEPFTRDLVITIKASV